MSRSVGTERAATGRPSEAAAPVSLGPAHLLVLAALATAVAGQGGYYLVPRVVISLLLAGAAVAFARTSALRRTLQQPVPVALAALAGWAMISATVAGNPLYSLSALSILGGAGVIVVVVSRSPWAQRDLVARGVIAIGTSAALTGWLGVAFRSSRWAAPESGLWRATTTITYTNAAAALMAPIALLTLARIASRPTTAMRLAALILIVGVTATLSRAGILGLALGYVALAGLLGFRSFMAATVRSVAGAAVATAGLGPTMIAHSPGRPGWAVAGLVAGLAVAVAPRPAGRTVVMGLAAGAVAGVATVSALLLVGRTHLPRLPAAWSDRITLSSPSRTAERRAALHVLGQHLVTGVGPGRAVFLWSTANRSLRTDRYAHDEYLQLAVEQGIVGEVLLVALVAGIIGTARAGRTHATRGEAGVTEAASADRRLERSMWAGAVVGLVVVGAQSGLDFLWHVPAVPLVAAVLVGLSAPTGTDHSMLHKPDTRQERA